MTRLCLPLLAAALLLPGRVAAADPPGQPNILIVLADDLGFSDLGCYGSEIRTPHLDSLARDGLRFTQFTNCARCWPTRAALLTGYYPQQVRRDTVPGLPSGTRGTRPAWAPLLPELLRPLGYRSYHSGKWHIDGLPLQNGFDRSYRLEDAGRYFSPRTHFEDDKPLPKVEPGSGFYTTTAIADHAIEYLREHAEKHPGRPFFHYVAFTSPHFPLHARPEDIARYRDAYTKGWDAVRADRWQRIQAMKLVPGTLSAPERDVGPPYAFPEALKLFGPNEVNRPVPWDSLSDSQQSFQAAKMAVHAAMVDRMDQEVGRILAQLRAMKALDNTLVLFLSDNGASAEMMVRDDGHDPAAAPGSALTHLCLGPGWSTVANTPFRRHKTWVHEGGIATPLVVHWPQGIAAGGELRHNPGHVTDLVPTLLALAGSAAPKTWKDKPVPPPPGRSLVPVLARDGSRPHEETWWQHEGNRALRRGRWKLVAAGAKAPWDLYDLDADRTEKCNVAADHPETVRDLAGRWEARFQEIVALAAQDAPPEKPGQPAKPSKPGQPVAPVKELILPGESFLIEGRPAFLLLPPPEKRTKPQPWVLYAPTLPGYPDAHEKWMHEHFLAAGIAVAGIDVGEAYGSPRGNEGLTALHREMTTRRGLAPRPCLLGRSRGGLWVASWAAAHPDRVAGLAGIYPVFDVGTYPGLDKAAPAYGLAPKDLEAGLGELNPIAKVHVLAKARVPALMIHGDDDRVVPLGPNSQAFADRYQAAGAGEAVRVIVAKGQGHNFWEGFFRCRELVDFAIARARAGAAAGSRP